MPKAMHRRLSRQATKKGLKGERRRKYIYGTMRKAGWTPSHQKAGRRSR